MKKSFNTKFLYIVLSVVFVFSAIFFGGCKDNGEVSFYMPDGAPALAFSKLIYESDPLTFKDVSYSVVSANEITSFMATGRGDIVLIPVTSASVNYDVKKDKYKAVSVITHGNLYLVSKSSFTLEDLKGKVVGVTGENQVPDLTLKAILKANGIEYVSLNGVNDAFSKDKVGLYYSTAPVIKQSLGADKIAFGLLPEPAVSIGNTKTYFRIALHDIFDENKSYPQAVLCVKSSVLNKYPNLVNLLKEKFFSSVAFLKENIALSVESVNSVGGTSLTPEQITEQVIDNSKIYWEDAIASKTKINEYLSRVIQVSNVGLGITTARTVEGDFFYKP